MSFSVADVITRLLDTVNADSIAHLQFWTETELYQWADEAAKRLARAAALFVDCDSSTTVTVVGNTAVYSNPDRHVALLNFALDGKMLKPSSSRELAALSDTWLADHAITVPIPAAPVTRVIQDWQGHDLFRVYPIPDVGGTLLIFAARYPADVTVDAPTVAAPLIVADYMESRIVAEARRREGDGALPEVAAALDQEAALVEQAAAQYWGKP